LNHIKKYGPRQSEAEGALGLKLLTLYDKLFIGLIIGLSIAGFIFNITFDAGMEQQYITIHVDNEFIKELSFNESSQKEVEIDFGPNNEHTAVLEINEGRVRMLPIDEELCPRGICSHTGWIKRSYQSIVCVPNSIVVHFSDTSIEGDVDGVTH